MTKREAKIRALHEAYNALEMHKDAALWENITVSDSKTGWEPDERSCEKVADEFDHIIQALFNRITRLDP